MAWRALPKFEKDSIAMRGDIPRKCAISAASTAISARHSGEGSTLTVQSAKRSVRFLKSIR